MVHLHVNPSHLFRLIHFYQKRLLFVVRDWGCPHEFPYGETGGEAYVRKQLQVSQKNLTINKLLR